MLSLLVKKAIIGDDTLIESFIFLEQETSVVETGSTTLLFLQPKCLHIMCLEENAHGRGPGKANPQPPGHCHGVGFLGNASRQESLPVMGENWNTIGV